MVVRLAHRRAGPLERTPPPPLAALYTSCGIGIGCAVGAVGTFLSVHLCNFHRPEHSHASDVVSDRKHAAETSNALGARCLWQAAWNHAHAGVCAVMDAPAATAVGSSHRQRLDTGLALLHPADSEVGSTNAASQPIATAWLGRRLRQPGAQCAPGGHTHTGIRAPLQSKHAMRLPS